jgi:hypothetical protein
MPPPPTANSAAARKARQAERCAAEHVALLHCYQQMTGIGYRSCKDDYQAFWACMRVAGAAEAGGGAAAAALAAARGGEAGEAEVEGPKTGRAWVALRAFGEEQWARFMGDDKEDGGGSGAGTGGGREGGGG